MIGKMLSPETKGLMSLGLCLCFMYSPCPPPPPLIRQMKKHQQRCWFDSNWPDYFAAICIISKWDGKSRRELIRENVTIDPHFSNNQLGMTLSE